MLTFYAHRFFNICSTLSSTKHLLDEVKQGKPLNKEETEFIAEQLRKLRPYCVDVGLRISVLQLDRVHNILESDDMQSIQHVDLAERIHDLSVRIQDELQLSLFMQIPNEKAKYYLEPWLSFGQVIVEKFPSLSRDIEEAGKCLASGRNTACVYHLMLIMEVGLRSLGKILSVEGSNKNWEAILQKADKEQVKPVKDQSVLWQSEAGFFSEAVANLRAVKNAWRNPTMHVRKDYSDEIAQDIYNAASGFLRHLASKLSG
jgi:hypothetical protein